MKAKIKIRAINLRKKGLSYREIKNALQVSKSTLSLWLRNVKINPKYQHRLKVKEFKGRAKALETIKKRIQARDKDLKANALASLKNLKMNKGLAKIFCALLYWAEGAKSGTSVSFINSDPLLVKTFIKLLSRGFGVKARKLKALLHLHSYHKQTKQINFWSLVSGIPKKSISLYNKTNSGKSKRQGYPGCFAVRCYNVKIQKELQFYYGLFAKKFGGLV